MNEDKAYVVYEWNNISTPPRRSGFYLLWCPGAAHPNAACDYRYQVAYFDARSDAIYPWHQQGTNHDVFEDEHEEWFHKQAPTHWRGFAPHSSDTIDPTPPTVAEYNAMYAKPPDPP